MAPTKSNSKHASASAVKPKKTFSAASIVGAPAQHNQSSRKGKKAWRKNVDIEDLEDKLEGLREEERTFGCVFHFSTFFYFVQARMSSAGWPYRRRQTAICLLSIPKAMIKACTLVTLKSSHITLASLSSKIPATLLPHYPKVTPNHLSALCRACGPCTAPKIPREFA